VVIDVSPVGSGCSHQPDSRSHDDQRDDEPARACREDPDPDLLREMIGFAAQRLMELEIEGLTGAACRDSDLRRKAGQRERDLIVVLIGPLDVVRR
jgi:hypothetical protein